MIELKTTITNELAATAEQFDAANEALAGEFRVAGANEEALDTGLSYAELLRRVLYGKTTPLEEVASVLVEELSND